jgi:hypothetical protein
MKELSGTARNYALVKTDDAFSPVVELIFIVSEPQYRFSVGEMVRERTPETIRISTNHGGVKRLIELLMECDKDFDELERQAAAAELCGEAKAHRPTGQAQNAADTVEKKL